ncbi:MAG: cytochrome P450 [Actinomycetia bacterium]|nr:cytochrome P450 [Actinomycetes bacterium]
MTLLDSTAAGPLRYNPYDYAIHEDPYPTYARLRTEAPCYHNEEKAFWALSRHDDVAAAFRDSDTYSSSHGVSLDPAATGPDAHRTMSFLAMDPPRHTRMRALVSKGFTPRRVSLMEDNIRDISRRHLDVALDSDTFDMVADFAGKLPMDIVSEMMGVPAADRDELRRLADLLVHRDEGVEDVPQAGAEAAISLVSYYSDMISERRSRRTDDLTSALLDAEIDGDRLTEQEVMGFLFLMVVAGNETTTKLLANAWYWAAMNPAQKARVLAEPEMIPQWVEETLRYDTSSQMLARTTTREVELHGVTIPEGGRVLLLAGSANRDESVFDNADRYDIGRDTSDLLSFGTGRHFCLGASLARLEARVCLEELLARVDGWEVDHQAAQRVHSVNVRGFATLPTSVSRR